ncbi:PREDICTED: DC-STAMP domain-containing protein 2-like [Rhagoletis zephyria]|uniref:DC-STAMP domain-containing protein 2-like n=1 Tax=Rhagoletis zephyria TaxID=28612 RepID=UPI00081191D1|nr:PREDICTED: DC-STAMP domain-containing protein 2-like [Rhagoletis zephyria]
MSEDMSTSVWPATTTSATNDITSTTTKSTSVTSVPKSHDHKYDKFFSKTAVTLLMCGYLIGVGLVVAWHMYETGCIQLPKGKWLKCNVAMLVFLLLSYSRNVRCIVTLCIPILCSSKGRSLLIASAFLLVATGPTMNILRNVDVLTRSLSCGQMQLKEALEEMLEVMKQPLVAIKKAVQVAMNNIKKIVKRVELLLYRIKELVLVVLSGIKVMFEWLNSIVSFCNKEFGTPFDRCMKIADDAMKDCSERLGYFKGLCQATHLFSVLCYTVKVVDVICVMVVFFDDAVLGTIMDKLREFTEEIKNMFDVSVTFDHDFTFTTVASRNLSDVGRDIVNEIHARMTGFFIIFGWLDVVSGLLCILVIIKAIYFKMKYLHIRSYQNHYLTKDILEIDEQRKGTELDRLLPLKRSERRKYIWISSCRLTRREIFRLMRSMLFLFISNIQIFCICFADYCFYWLLAMITYYGSQQANIEGECVRACYEIRGSFIFVLTPLAVPPFITVDVKGSGYVADIFRGIVEAFEPLSQKYNIDATPCLPMPKRPNFKRYLEISGICLLAWIFLFCEPYGLRLRHIVMRLYYPVEAKQRAVWLYNEILLKRMTFLKLLRRKARAKFKNEPREDPYTFLDWIRAKTNRCFLCRLIFGHRKGDTCILCGFRLKGDKVECSTPGCKAVYCQSCFDESSQMCCICRNPVEYGDGSDISEEKDSSDDPDAVRQPHESDQYCIWVP